MPGGGAWFAATPRPSCAIWSRRVTNTDRTGMLADGGRSMAGADRTPGDARCSGWVCRIARRWKVAAEGHHVRCSQCGTIAGPFEGSPLWVSAIAQLAREYGQTPPGFRCPGCWWPP
jgi:hypothetical protein